MLNADRILGRALELGADLAGFADVDALGKAPSARVDTAPVLHPAARSVLVLGLSHPASEPALDWWGGPGGTDGNRRLQRVSRELGVWLEGELGLGVWILPYHVERGGLYLKDAAVLAGLGVIGVNNLVVTPSLGPRVRWKAVALDQRVAGEASAGFDPCAGCARPCVRACPQDALAGGRYTRSRCAVQMQADEAGAASHPGDVTGEETGVVRYCRACELACPVGRAHLEI